MSNKFEATDAVTYIKHTHPEIYNMISAEFSDLATQVSKVIVDSVDPIRYRTGITKKGMSITFGAMYMLLEKFDIKTKDTNDGEEKTEPKE